MAEENTNTNQDADVQNAGQIEKLESDIKLAFKEDRFDDVKQIASEIKNIDAENHLADHMLEKVTESEEKELKKLNNAKVKDLVAEIKDLTKGKNWDNVIEKANELLSLEWNHKAALKALTEVSEAQNVDYKTLITTPAPEGQVIAEYKPGFFERLFSKKKKKEEVVQEATDAPADTAEEKNDDAVEAQNIAPQDGEQTDAQPTTKETEQPEEKPGFFAGLFKKKEAGPVGDPVVDPVGDPVDTSVSQLTTDSTEQPDKPLDKALDKQPDTPLENKGNIFTKLFKKDKEEKPAESIIDTIVAQSNKVKEEKKEEKKREESDGKKLLKFANLFLRFAIVFVLISAGFFYIFNIDENNHVLKLAGKENYAIRLKKAADTLGERKETEKKINKDIELYQKGYKDNYEQTVDKIITNRMDWPKLKKNLDSVTESVYEKNALANYVQYNNYSYDVKSGKLTVSGTLSDPLGKNLTKMAELEDAFMYFPKNKNDSSDTTKPYFYNLQEFKSYAKSLDKTTGRFTSNFSISLYTKKQATKK